MALLHTVEIKNRRVNVSPLEIVQGGINSDEIVVVADEEWQKCDQILATFHNESVQNPVTLVYSGIGSALNIPKAVMSEPGTMRISFTGYQNGRARIVTEIQGVRDAFQVVESGVIAGDIVPDDEDEVGDLVGACLEAAQEAKDAAKMAEEASKRATKISADSGEPLIGGITGDLYIDTETGKLFEFKEA